MPFSAVEPTFVETMSAWGTLIAAAATTVSAAFIAWQIYFTRKSVQATEEALGVAQRELEHGRLLRADAQRAAIDAEMPRITVEVITQSSQVWRPDMTEPDPYGGEPDAKDVDSGEIFTVPRDNNVPLGVDVQIAISNDGPRRARVHLDKHGDGKDLVIKPGDVAFEWVRRVQPLSEWVAIANARAKGEPGEERKIASIGYTYPGDVGATEIHNVVQGGTIVEPVRDNAGGWRVKALGPTPDEPFGVLNAMVRPFTRIYWASRAANRKLDFLEEPTD